MPRIVHGDLKGVGVSTNTLVMYALTLETQLNVLVSYGGEAVLGGFGAAKATVDSEQDDEPWKKGSIRWMAPELLAAGDSTTSASTTASSDIYAFGCFILEVCRLQSAQRKENISEGPKLISGRDPYYDLETDISVVMRISSGGKPPIPQDVYVPRDAKGLMNDCWSDSRPDIESLVRRMISCAEKARKASQNLPPYSEFQVRSETPPLPEKVHEYFGREWLHERMASSPTVDCGSRPINSGRSPQANFRSVFTPTPRPSLQRAHSAKKEHPSLDLQSIASSLKSAAGFESVASLLSEIDRTCKKMKTNKYVSGTSKFHRS
jgi:serine/threonine protein kinase